MNCLCPDVEGFLVFETTRMFFLTGAWGGTSLGEGTAVLLPFYYVGFKMFCCEFDAFKIYCFGCCFSWIDWEWVDCIFSEFESGVSF